VKHTYSFVVGILDGKKPFRRARCNKEGNIIEMDLKVI
jgi:hypothetical protein